MGQRRILFMANYRPNKAPGQRYRFEQYLPALRDNNLACIQSPIFDREDESYIHKSGHIVKKALLAFRSAVQRFFEALAVRKYSLVFYYREALFWGPPFIERLISKIGHKTILDFDDSIWMDDGRKKHPLVIWLRNPQKTKALIKLVDLVIVGNEYLANYCRENGAKKIEIVPSTIDTDTYQPNYPENSEVVTIGWTGSPSTIIHFESCLGALKKLKEKYKDKIQFRLIGDPNYEVSELGIKALPWMSETEVSDLHPIHIGIMPLPDNEWTRGKCGMKGLQYMALEIPTVMSPVGVNSKIIQDGENGFLADTQDEWVEKLSRLIEDPELRVRLGKAGRKTVLENYSVASQKDRYVKIFKDLIES